MNVRILMLAGLAAGLLVTGSAAAEEQGAAAATDSSSGKAQQTVLGEKEYKERINVVARKPANHDLPYIESRDRTGWNEFNSWQGIRDERPIVARKTMGFHAPYPHRPRAERVLLISRGPLRGPAPTE
jgi:hypothetical protein